MAYTDEQMKRMMAGEDVEEPSAEVAMSAPGASASMARPSSSAPPFDPNQRVAQIHTFAEKYPKLAFAADWGGEFLKGAGQMFAGATLGTAGRVGASLKAGLTGDFSGVEMPIVGHRNPLVAKDDAMLSAAAGEEVTTEQIAKSKEGNVASLSETAMMPLETVGGPAMKGGTGLVGDVLAVAKKNPRMKQAIDYVATGVGKLSGDMYAKALKPTMGPLKQRVVEKAKELGISGTTGGILRKLKAGMEKYGGEVESYLEKNRDKTTHIDALLAKIDEVKAELMSTDVQTGEKFASSVEADPIIAKLDDFTQRAARLADKDGNVKLGDLIDFKRGVKAAETPSTRGRILADMPGVQRGKEMFLQAVRNVTAELDPALAAANAAYHKHRLVFDAMNRTSMVASRNNGIGLISWMLGAGSAAAGNHAEGFNLMAASELLRSPLWRTAVGAGAAGVERLLVNGAGFDLPRARKIAVPLLNMFREADPSVTEVTEDVQVDAASPGGGGTLTDEQVRALMKGE